MTSHHLHHAVRVQVLLTKVFKGLAVSQAKLGIKMMDVKSSINVNALTAEEVDVTVSSVVMHTLQQKGWRCLHSGLMLRSDFIAAAPGVPVTTAAAKISVRAEQPSSVAVIVHSAGE